MLLFCIVNVSWLVLVCRVIVIVVFGLVCFVVFCIVSL